MDDNEHKNPTGSNIIEAFEDLASLSKSGDPVYFHYSGMCWHIYHNRYHWVVDSDFACLTITILFSLRMTGHGGKLRDQSGDESDGYDETIIPVDYDTYGQIRDDTLYKKLIGVMRSGVNLTCVMDCCHSGTVLDLPYKYVANGSSTEMTLDDDANLDLLQQLAADLELEGRWLLPCIGVLLFMALIAIVIWLFVGRA